MVPWAGRMMTTHWVRASWVCPLKPEKNTGANPVAKYCVVAALVHVECCPSPHLENFPTCIPTKGNDFIELLKGKIENRKV